jgi:hypothetical protein
MKHRITFLISVVLLFAGSINGADTLNVLAIMLEFKEDAVNDQTTGTGKFNSGDDFPLDPKPHNPKYFEDHLEFARRYFYKVSSGKLVVRYAVDPTIVQLNKTIRHYRMPSKKPSDSNNVFIRELNLGLMSFAHDALRAASVAGLLNNGRDAGNSTRYPTEKVTVKKDSTLILFFHAGASGLTDGGGMGGLFADTPADIIDSYIWPDDFNYYHGQIYDDRTGLNPAAPILYDIDKENSGRKGIYSSDSSNFVDKMLMCSETASQDSLNFGINGIVVNQLARGMGLPDLWNTSTGGTAVGSFCLMDVGGYNTVSGFIPIKPSAWCREYMKWSTVMTPPDSVTSKWTFDLPSINISDSIAKIPLSSTEYILLENRQWLSKKDSTLKVTHSNSEDTAVYVSEYPYDSIYQPYYFGKDYGPVSGSWVRLMIDSLCNDTPNCASLKVNTGKLKGVILDASNYDIGLPGNGVLMWHVNNGVVKRYVDANMVNAEIDNRGVDLKEADGVEDVGADYRDIFGQKSDAYGDHEDFYPHKNSKKNRFISALTPYSITDPSLNLNTNADRYENTSTRDGGYTGVTIKIDTIRGAYDSREYYGSWGDKVRSYAADRYKVTVSWIQRQGAFPKFSDEKDKLRYLSIIPNSSHLLAISDSSVFTRMKSRGDSLVVDSTVYNRGLKLDKQHPSVLGNTIYYTAHAVSSDSFYINRYDPITFVNTNIVAFTSETASVPLLLLGYDSVLAGFKSGLLIKTTSVGTYDTLRLNEPIRAIAGNKSSIIVVSGNKVLRVDSAFRRVNSPVNLALSDSGNVGLALGDFYPDKAGYEIVVNDANGNVWLLDASLFVISGWPVKIAANGAIAPSIGDVNGDGFLDILVPGENYIHALSRTATPLTGWPYKIGWSGNAGQMNAAVSLADVDGDGAQEVFAPLPGGRLAVIDNDGKTYAFVSSARQFDLSLPLGGEPVYGCVVGNFDIDIDSVGNIPEHLEVFAYTEDGALQGFNIPIRGRGKIAWSTPFGGQEHNSVALDPDKPSAVRSAVAIDTLFVWPNPVRGSNANLRYKLSKGMDKVSIKVFNAAGSIVYDKSNLPSQPLWNQIQLSFNKLAPGFYSLKLEIESSGKKAVRFANFGLIK